MKLGMILVLLLLLAGCSLTAEPKHSMLDENNLTAVDSEGVIDARDPCGGAVMERAVNNADCGAKLYEVLQQDLIILFDDDKAQITPPAQAEINAMAHFMAQHGKLKLLLEGHTRVVDTESHHLALSKRRAEAVREALMKAGVAGTRLEIIGVGETHPLLMGENERRAAAHRRVVGALTSMNEGVRWRLHVYQVAQAGR